jgi:hypothetical protein
MQKHRTLTKVFKLLDIIFVFNVVDPDSAPAFQVNPDPGF